MSYLPVPALLAHLPRLPPEIWYIIDRMIHRMYMEELRNNIHYDITWVRIKENGIYMFSFVHLPSNPNYYRTLDWSDED